MSVRPVDIAERLGLARQTIDGFIRSGMPTTSIEEAEAWYKANSARFTIPERRGFRYAFIDAAKIAATLSGSCPSHPPQVISASAMSNPFLRVVGIVPAPATRSSMFNLAP